jgi:hypothetical protein
VKMRFGLAISLVATLIVGAMPAQSKAIKTGEAFALLQTICGGSYPSFKSAGEKAGLAGYVTEKIQGDRKTYWGATKDTFVAVEIDDGQKICAIYYESNENSESFARAAAAFGEHLGEDGNHHTFNYLNTGKKMWLTEFQRRARASLRIALVGGQ